MYTSADSVFQIAAHEKVIPLKELYRICEIARRILNGPDCVARVIARPFLGAPGGFYRTGNRKDFAVEPPEPTVLDRLKEKGLKTVAVGKIASIFAYRGITEERPSKDNGEALDQTIDALHSPGNGLIFVNLVDFDMLWGHRRDVEGYAAGLESLDRRIPDLIAALGEGECLILCADHGCDPTAHGTDHTREYVPILVYEARLKGGTDLGTRETMADIGQTVADNFGLQLGHGISFLDQLA